MSTKLRIVIDAILQHRPRTHDDPWEPYLVTIEDGLIEFLHDNWDAIQAEAEVAELEESP